MNRATAVTAAVTAALAMGTMAAAATVLPAMAAPRPSAAHPVTHAKKAAAHRSGTAKKAAAHALVAAQAAKLAGDPTVQVGSELDNGKFVTVVTCQGAATPPPIQLALPGTPLTAKGVGPSAGLLSMLQQPNPYKTVYTCTVVVKEKPAPAPRSAAAGTPNADTKTDTKPDSKPGRPRICVTNTGGAAGGASGASGRRGAVCAKRITISTGFGGLAPQVRLHRP